MFGALLIALVASSTGVLGHDNRRILSVLEDCRSSYYELDFTDLIHARTKVQVDAMCTAAIEVFTCTDREFQKEFSTSLEKMVDNLAETPGSYNEVNEHLKFMVNLKAVLTELCTEGTQLNEDFKPVMECIDTFKWEDFGCEDKANAANEVYTRMNGHDFDDDGYCLKNAVGTACGSAGIHEKCGEQAFHTVHRILKGTTLFPSMLCTKEQLEILRTTLVDRLDLSEAEKNLYKLGLDLK